MIVRSPDLTVHWIINWVADRQGGYWILGDIYNPGTRFLTDHTFHRDHLQYLYLYDHWFYPQTCNRYLYILHYIWDLTWEYKWGPSRVLIRYIFILKSVNIIMPIIPISTIENLLGSLPEKLPSSPKFCWAVKKPGIIKKFPIGMALLTCELTEQRAQCKILTTSQAWN